jgi:succinate dehydrogenase / fumarate reductase iron-sulfur subunit
MAARQSGPSGRQSDSVGRKNPVTEAGHLPVNELLFERQGAASPFGEDVVFPLPAENLPYAHAEEAAPHS